MIKMRTALIRHEPIDGQGRLWDAGHHVRLDPQSGPGWYVFARRPEFGGNYVRLVARPDVPARKHKGYNCKVRRGWRTRREAARVCDALTAAYRSQEVTP